MPTYTYVVTTDDYFISTIDDFLIVLDASGTPTGCLAPNPPPARPITSRQPPPNSISPAQFPPAGLLAIPLTLAEQLPDRIPSPPPTAPTAYTPTDRLTAIQTVLAGFPYNPAQSLGCQAFSAVQAAVDLLRSAYGDDVGYLRWEYGDDPAWDGHTCLLGPVRYWANLVAYSDGSFYWILGGLGGYGLEPYWVFGGMADPAFYVDPTTL